MSTFCLPEQDNHWKYVKNWVESEPLPGYQHAPPEAIEAFKDIKYAIRIHWGLYSLAHLQGESWPFLKMSKRQKQAYQGLYRRFNPTQFSAERWMTWFERVGLKCFAITTKHHEGFSLWDTQTRVVRRVNYTARGGPRIEPCDLAYSVMETPFGRDILTELCDAAHRHNLKIDFYFSHPDWYDADFRPYVFHPLQTPRVRQFPGQYGGEHYLDRLDQNQTSVVDECSPQETRHMLARHRAQLVELLTRFGKIDLLCLDMWLGADIWPEMRATLLQLRALQPEVMLRARGIGNYGDYYTPEGFVPGSPENTAMPWMVIHPLARSFSYDPNGRYYKGWRWIVNNIIDCAAKGGSFMVGVGPDETGWFHPNAVQALEEAGDWLRVNGEAIYDTRSRDTWYEGEHIRFTRRKDGRTVYAVTRGWPGRHLRLNSISPEAVRAVSLVGSSIPLTWRTAGEGIVIELPYALQRAANRPCKYAYSFKVEGENSID